MKRTPAIILGILVWVVVLGGAYSGIRALYHAFFPPPHLLISLSVDVGANGGLSIGGEVALDGERPAKGLVQLTVKAYGAARRLVLFADVVDGKFGDESTTALPGFAPDDSILVEAEVFLAKGDTTVTGEQVATWNVAPWEPWLPAIAAGAFLAIVLFMFFVYTGGYTPGKNRIAIGAAYCFVAVALMLPFAAPFALNALPGFRDAMVASPVGLVKVHKLGQDGDQIELNQWALNIGGVPVAAKPEPPAANAEAGFAARAASAEIPLYDVASGIVIPLYVLVLAVFGGAVNMTREVPKLQRDMASVWSLPDVQPMAKGLMRLASFQPAAEATSGEAQEKNEESDAAPAQAAPDKAAEENRQTEMNRLRGKLINQYMFLITAPFIAIVTYYLLFMVEGKLAESIPVVVLVSFSAGLLSETVLRTISEQAEHYLDRMRDRLAADKGRGQPPGNGQQPPPGNGGGGAGKAPVQPGKEGD